MIYGLFLLAFCLLVLGLLVTNAKLSYKSRDLLYSLLQDQDDIQSSQTNNRTAAVRPSGVKLAYFRGRLGRAGYLTSTERNKAIASLSLLEAVFLISGYWSYGIIGAITGSYFGLIFCLYFLKSKQKQFERAVLYNLPLMLEALILLVEAGLGIVPAVGELVKTGSKGVDNPVIRVLSLVHRLSDSGMPFQQALSNVANAIPYPSLRHVLVHLDISETEGGEIIPSLRSLSDHIQTEWRLGVETRVRQLENQVVFPVFIAVLGLAAYVAAVPMKSVVEVTSNLKPAKIEPMSHKAFDVQRH